MKPVTGKSTTRMRVATAFTGVIAGTVLFGPARAARANSAPEMPYKIWVDTKPNVTDLQVCGYKDLKGSPWECTGVISNPGFANGSHFNYMGDNYRLGEVKVFVWSGSPPTNEHHDTCNTNHYWWGSLRSNGTHVYLTRVNGEGMGVSINSSC